jgi:DNA-binding GntR family transcriptional regulator
MVSVPETSPTEQTTIADRVCEELRIAIIRGELSQGAKLNEPLLAARYGISRGPLREALRRLEGLGLVDHVPHAGARVTRLDREEMLHIYDVREALEGMAARLAASHVTREEVAELNALLEQHAEQVQADEGRAYFQHEGNLDFHYRIVLASRNPKLIQLLASDLYHRVRMYRYQSSQRSLRPEQALLEHRRIVDALADGDDEVAELLMRRHIQRARRAIAEQPRADSPSPTHEVVP